MATTIYDDLDARQLAAVLAPEGQVIVVAGAGAGKTRVLTRRVMYLVDNGVPPSSVLCVTFTRKAAEEMQNRLARVPCINDAWICTLHSVCYKILRAEVSTAARLGVPPGWTIPTPQYQLSLVGKLARIYHVAGTPQQLLHRISRLKLGLDMPDPSDTIWTLYDLYVQALSDACMIDFDDLLVYTRELLLTHDDIRLAYANRFVHVLLDECQDSSDIDWDIIYALSSVHGNLFAVGDPNQAIYGFRGANVATMMATLQSDELFSVQLTANYRSQELIVTAANALIAHNDSCRVANQEAKRLAGAPIAVYEAVNESDEGLLIANNIAERCNDFDLSDIAILTRTNHQLPAIAQALTRYRLPYRYHNKPTVFEQSATVGTMAYLRLSQDPCDVESFMVACKYVLPDPVPHNTVRMVAGMAQGCPLDVAIQQLGANLSATSRDKMEHVLEFASSLSAMLPSEAIDCVLRDTSMGSKPWNAAIVYELVSIAYDFEEDCEAPSVSGFIELVDEMSGCVPHESQDGINLMTMHAAKGREFAYVILAGAEEGLLPHFRASDQDAQEEERRLMYVGMTRAMDELAITYCRSRSRYGKIRECKPSRFLEEALT